MNDRGLTSAVPNGPWHVLICINAIILLCREDFSISAGQLNGSLNSRVRSGLCLQEEISMLGLCTPAGSSRWGADVKTSIQVPAVGVKCQNKKSVCV